MVKVAQGLEKLPCAVMLIILGWLVYVNWASAHLATF